jgi:hypothetical protein
MQPFYGMIRGIEIFLKPDIEKISVKIEKINKKTLGDAL